MREYTRKWLPTSIAPGFVPSDRVRVKASHTVSWACRWAGRRYVRESSTMITLKLRMSLGGHVAFHSVTWKVAWEQIIHTLPQVLEQFPLRHAHIRPSDTVEYVWRANPHPEHWSDLTFPLLPRAPPIDRTVPQYDSVVRLVSGHESALMSWQDKGYKL